MTGARLKDRLLSISASLLFLEPIVLFGGEPPTKPILRIETGMHTAQINSVAVDPANRYFVTASDDHSIRVWDLSSGELRRVIWPASVQGSSGLWAVATSPNGSTIAATGFTTSGRKGGPYSIDLFDRDTGRLRQRVKVRAIDSAWPAELDWINRVAFSPDGRFLAAASREGLHLFDAQSFVQIGESATLGESHDVTFSRDGLLATASLYGVRVYAIDGERERSIFARRVNLLRLVAHTEPTGGAEPCGVAFSPDGKKLAVGFCDSAKVAVLSVADLSLVVSPDVAGTNGFLARVAWASDGHRLFAAGTYGLNGIRQIRAWSQDGAGAYTDLPASEDTIADLAPLADGGVLFASSQPALGRIDRQGNRMFFNGPSIADYRGALDKFLLSPDGSVVQFGYHPFGASPARFSLTERRLELEPSQDERLKGPRTEIEGLKVVDWKNTEGPKLDAQPLALDSPHELARSAAIAPAGDRVLIGADWHLYLFNRTASEEWRVRIPAVAWDVNISVNGSVAVAALADGTIRWYRMTDGQELLAFFPHADKKRWVLWSQSGYYDCSPDAEDLIGWQVNRGENAAADFFPASRFRSVYYRPDIVGKILGTLDEGEAVRLANAETGRKERTTSVVPMLPPVVEITSPADGFEVGVAEIVVRFDVRSPGQPVTRVRALVDGRPAEGTKGIGVASEEGGVPRELKIAIPPRDSEISILAENANAVSSPATIHLRWKGKPQEFVIKPNLYVLSIGVGKYENEQFNLVYPAKDATDFARVMSKQKGSLYRDVVAKVLTNDRATKDEILDGLDWITKETTSKDVAAVFVSGHGVNDPNGQYYFLPYNADVEKLKRTGLSFSDVQSTVAALHGKTLFFVDTCHSGNIMGTRKGITDINGVINELASAENGAVVFAASTGNQYSLEDKAWGNGAFTKAVVEGLSGRADHDHTGRISINMLDLYISERVKELTKGKQTPTTTKPQTIPDFPVAVTP
jgi:DNA-binding beta-propeller fold protein YncE